MEDTLEGKVDLHNASWTCAVDLIAEGCFVIPRKALQILMSLVSYIIAFALNCILIIPFLEFISIQTLKVIARLCPWTALST